MKISIFGSVLLLLMLSSDWCGVLVMSAEAVTGGERTTMWVLADQQIYSVDKGHLICGRLTSATTYTALLSSTYFTIEGKDVGIYQSLPAAETTSQSETIFGLSALKITFSYDEEGETSSQEFELLAFTDSSGLNTQMNKLVAAASTSSKFMSPKDTLWLYLEKLGTETAASVAVGAQGVSSRTVMIVDFVSNTTLSITAWQDGTDDAASDTKKLYNHVYMINVRTNSSILTNSENKLVSGCTERDTSNTRSGSEGGSGSGNGTKIRLEASSQNLPEKVDTTNQRKKRLAPRDTSDCSSLSSSDSAMSSTIVSKACTQITQSSTYFGRALATSVSALNTVRQVDDSLFSFGESLNRSTTAASIGFLCLSLAYALVSGTFVL